MERKHDLVRERTRKKSRGDKLKKMIGKKKRETKYEGGKGQREGKKDRGCIAYNSRALKAAKLEAYNFIGKKVQMFGMMSTYSLK